MAEGRWRCAYLPYGGYGMNARIYGGVMAGGADLPYGVMA